MKEIDAQERRRWEERHDRLIATLYAGLASTFSWLRNRTIYSPYGIFFKEKKLQCCGSKSDFDSFRIDTGEKLFSNKKTNCPQEGKNRQNNGHI